MPGASSLDRPPCPVNLPHAARPQAVKPTANEFSFTPDKVSLTGWLTVAQPAAQLRASQPQAAQAPATLPKAGRLLGLDLLPLIAAADALVVAAGVGARFALRRR